MKARKGWSQGMNKDTASSRVDPMSYYDLKNFRVVTEEGLSTGALENELGHTISFSVPDTPEMTVGGDVIPIQTDLVIIGWGTINDTIVIFTTNEHGANPSGAYGQIWKMDYDEGTGSIIGLVNGALDTNVHLVYNQQLNFSTYHRIGRVVGRYETSAIQRVYWTDNNNPVATFNVALTSPLLVDLDNIYLAPRVDMSQPVIQSVGTGTLPTRAVIQFAYRLQDEGGALTLYSPTSTLYPLTSDDIYTDPLTEIRGNGTGDVRSVTYTIKDLDTSYSVIQHVAIVYEQLDVPTVYQFKEEQMPGSGELSVTCDSISTAIQIPLTEFNLLSSGFEVCKDIEVKDSRLIAANTKTEDFVVDFDARVYRFDSNQDALITDVNQGNITIDGATMLITAGPGIGDSWTEIADDHDAINPYNKEQNTNWLTTQQYLFQTNGSTYGAEGPNVSIVFVEENFQTNTKFTPLPTTFPHLTVDSNSASDSPSDLDHLNADGTTKTFEITNQLKNFASGYAPSFFKGYARGEIYRFGVVFYSKKGSPSFVNWIGDIKMPDPLDGFHIQDVVASEVVLNSLGIQITIDVSSIQSQISGYSIVRVRRDPDDRTRLGTGMFMYFDIQDVALFNSLMHRWEAFNDSLAPAAGNPYTITNDVNIFGISDASAYHLTDKPGFNNPQITTASSKRVGYLISPMGQNYAADIKPLDYLKTTGYYEATATRYVGGSGSDTSKSYGFYYKLGAYQAVDHGAEWFEIGAGRTLKVGEHIFTGTDIITGVTGANSLRNAAYCRETGGDTDVPLGLGNAKVATMLEASPTVPNNTGDPATNANWYAGGDYRAITFGGVNADESTQTLYFKEVAYCRQLSSQYGGDTHEAKSINQYMSCGHHQAVNTSISSPATFKVYGGDVFVNYFDDEEINYYWVRGSAFLDVYDDPPGNKLSIAVVAPVETIVNTNFRSNGNWAADRDAGDMSSPEAFAPFYDTVWSQENSVEEKFFAEDFLSSFTEEHPHQLWASEKKIDGELIDNWRIFKTNNVTEVNGVHGPINRIINWRDRLFFYQDKAFGIASIDERVMITDTTGQELALGSGGVFPDYSYISTTTGSVHQFSVVASELGIYHFDARLKKIYQYAGGPSPLSDISGMSSYLGNAISGAVLKEDNTLKTIEGGPIGVHATPDYRFNRVLFTFLNHQPTRAYGDPNDTTTSGNWTYKKGDIVTDGGNFYEASEIVTVINTVISPPAVPIPPPITTITELVLLTDYNHATTFSYNEMLKAFESFYDYKPGLYLQYGRRLLSVSPFNSSEAYEHNRGDYSKYYGLGPYPSTINTIMAEGGEVTKIFNNLTYQSELFDEFGGDVFNETFDFLEVTTNYQTTGKIALTVGTDIKRRMRAWRHIVKRDTINPLARIRNPWAHVVLEYSNTNNRRLVMHDLIYSFTPSEY